MKQLKEYGLTIRPAGKRGLRITLPREFLKEKNLNVGDVLYQWVDEGKVYCCTEDRGEPVTSRYKIRVQKKKNPVYEIALGNYYSGILSVSVGDRMIPFLDEEGALVYVPDGGQA